tara:strand:+ start:297 stop:494 length:198 start_codon:yes stop_codon:yes gene_type:complete
MQKRRNSRKEIYDPITGQWIPSELTEDDVYRLMKHSEELKAEEDIMRKIFLKSIGATDGWDPREN